MAELTAASSSSSSTQPDEEGEQPPSSSSSSQPTTASRPRGSNDETEEGGGSFAALLDFYRRNDVLVVLMDVPGLSREDFDVLYDGYSRELVVKGHRHLSKQKENGNAALLEYFLDERAGGAFERTVRIPEGLRPRKKAIRVYVRFGVLKVRVKLKNYEATPTLILVNYRLSRESADSNKRALPSSSSGRPLLTYKKDDEGDEGRGGKKAGEERKSSDGRGTDGSGSGGGGERRKEREQDEGGKGQREPRKEGAQQQEVPEPKTKTKQEEPKGPKEEKVKEKEQVARHEQEKKQEGGDDATVEPATNQPTQEEEKDKQEEAATPAAEPENREDEEDGEGIEGEHSEERPKRHSVNRPSLSETLRGERATEAIQQEAKRVKTRKMVAEELLATEKTYVNSLETVVKQVIVPLKKTSLNVLTQDEIDQVFLNTEQILAHHQRFLSLLERRIENWNDDSKLGDIFLNETDFIWDYGKFLNDYETSVQVSKYLQRKIPDFAAILKSFEEEQDRLSKDGAGLNLDSFFVTPVQRVPRYLLLLQQLQKYTNEADEEKAALAAAEDKIRGILTKLNSSIERDKLINAKKIISIDESISDLPLRLFKSDRTLEKEGKVILKLSGSKKEGTIRIFQKSSYLFLFNDILVATEESANKSKDKRKSKNKNEAETTVNAESTPYSYMSSVPLNDVVSVEEGAAMPLVAAPQKGDGDDEEEEEKTAPNAFHFETKGGKVWTVIASSAEEKEAWMRIISKGASQ
ncbi:Spore wall protein 2 [Balamuthia mandrillaris]